jgi:division protein CdvB (Snf7/Vps24/ESCRT-III family)
MKKFEKQLYKLINEKYLGETEQEKMSVEERKSFLEAVANFHKLGEMIYSNAKLQEVTKTLKSVMERAEKVTMQESEHWFDNVTVSRHMKQMNEAMKVFEKTAGEMNGLQQRLESAYEDMGTVLNRYYKINEALKEDGYTAGVDDGAAALEEDSYTAGVDDKRAGDSVPYPGKDM